MAVARLSCAEGEETRHAGASKWFTSFFGGAGYRAARDTLPGPGVGEHLHRVIGVRAKSVQNRAQCMADFRLSARLLLQNRAARLVQQLVPLHDPVNFVGRRRLPGHLDVLPGQGGARHVLRRGAWNCVVQIRRDQGMKIKLYRGEGRKERGRGKKREREWVGWGNDGVCGNSSGGGSDETGVWLPMRATANGATREFSVSRGNSRTKRGEVNWCRVDCFCVADWKARIPPSEWQLLEPRSGGAIDLSSLLLVIRKRVVCRCATMFATSGWAGRGVDRLVNSDRNADLLPPGRVSNGGKSAARVSRKMDPSRFPRNAKGYSSSSRGNSFDGYPSRVPPANEQSGQGKWERDRRAFPLSSRVNSRHRTLFLFEYIYIYMCVCVCVCVCVCITVEALLQIFFFLSLFLFTRE